MGKHLKERKGEPLDSIAFRKLGLWAQVGSAGIQVAFKDSSPWVQGAQPTQEEIISTAQWL